MKISSKKNLACFDFDGTITTKDSLPDFIKYAVGKPIYYTKLFFLSPLLICYMLKIIPNYTAKQMFLSCFFKGWVADRFLKIAEQYSDKQIDKITRPVAIRRIKFHQKQGDTVVIVSASIDYWLKKWCENRSVDLIATRLEISKGKITGKFASANCYGMEKVNRIKEKYNLDKYNDIYAYGDSSGDKEMMQIATKRYYKYFN